MPSLLELIDQKREDYSDENWDTLLQKTLKESDGVNYYELMGISIDDQSQLKANYRALAKLLHPDMHSGKLYYTSTGALFALVTKMNNTLADPELERAYRATIPSPIPASGAKVHRHTASPSFFSPPQPRGKVTVHGDVHRGEVFTSEKDDIHITGNVYGHVKNNFGKIIVDGDVIGVVENMFGENRIKGDVSPTGHVKNVWGFNLVDGDILGEVTRALDFDPDAFTDKASNSAAKGCVIS